MSAQVLKKPYQELLNRHMTREKFAELVEAEVRAKPDADISSIDVEAVAKKLIVRSVFRYLTEEAPGVFIALTAEDLFETEKS